MSTDPGILLMILSSARFGFDQFFCFFVIALISELENLKKKKYSKTARIH